MKERLIYYKDELNDEFSAAQITPRYIGKDYRYERGALAHLFWYRAVATPLAWTYLKMKFHHRVVGAERLEAAKGKGIFLYGNHTQIVADALIPSFVSMPRHAYVVVHPNNVSMPVLGRITPYLGALPLPDDAAAAVNFSQAITRCVAHGEAVVIYPEAHIWPYYTGIRPFPDASFLYPIRHGAPVFCFTNVYRARKHGDHPDIVTYVDGPFYADGALPMRQRRRALRDAVYKAMCERAALSNCSYIEYRPKEE